MPFATHSLSAHDQLLLSGYSCYPKEDPYLQVDDLATNSTTRHYIPVWSKKLGLKPLAARYCLGTYDMETQKHIPCPQKRQVKPQYESCYTCF